MKKSLALILALIMCLSLLASCGTTPPAASEAPATEAPVVSESPTIELEDPEPPIAGDTRTFTDSVERTVEVPAVITKISPSGALAQMFLLAIAPDLMVSIASEYSDDQSKYIPASVTGLPVVGQFYGSADLNLETIASINPDVVIDVGEPKKTIVEDMDSITTSLAIPAVHITATLNSAPDAFRQLGILLGREERGEELALYCEKILAQTNDVMAQVGDNKVTTLYLVGSAGTNVLAKGSFHSEVIDWLTENAAVVDEVSSKGSGNETDLEQIALWNPAFIIFAPDVDAAAALADPTWQQLDAIANAQYLIVPQGPYNWMGSPPSINRYLGLIWLTYNLYPDYATFDINAEIAEYYEQFYGYELTPEEVGAFLGAE
ncbi:MAG: ABC transporter substrate-binding protein [Oscillospiraceae bacterium]|jgi:iron complex transport system substrate-binding protein|nr:ABC transporter substrate-binding protein [Oscillospiraceae bacterium]